MTQQNAGRETGTVYSVSARGWAFIQKTPQKRFFAHISEIKADRMPEVGDTVTFIAAPPRKNKQLPCAIDVRLADASGVVSE